MKIITLDFETFFSGDYTLKKLTTEGYVRDPRFQALGVGIRDHLGQTLWADGPVETRELLSKYDWADTGVVCHHAHFDGLILSHHFAVRPAFWFDTLSMARLVIGNASSLSLSSLARRYSLEDKSLDYASFTGRRWEELDEATRHGLGVGCLRDVDLTWALFQRLLKGDGAHHPPFPVEELGVIDTTIRMFTEPQLIGDVKHYEWIRDKAWACKNEMLMDLGTTEKELGSNSRFQSLLEREGVEVEWKEGKNGPIQAFAKTDEFMRELEDHDNDRVRQLVNARLEVKSSIDETRAGRFASMAARGPLPLYLQYCGASTTRWSGGDKVNPQNLRREGDLRKGIQAPRGYVIGVIDKSQIECRFLNYVARQDDVTERFRKGEDPYLPLASQFYRREITKEDKQERGLGKLLELSCGYGAGGDSIVRTAARGTYGPPVTLTPDQGLAARNVYRSSHPHVTKLWEEADLALRWLQERRTSSWRSDRVEGLMVKDSKIILPNGSFMNYWLEYDSDNQTWMRKTRYGWRRIWGGVVCQNLCEALSRLDLAQGILRLKREGFRCLCTVHDEAWFLYPEAQAEVYHQRAIAALSESPAWAPHIPIAVEGSFGERYEK